ncbi:MAG: phosphoribosylaminoimidazolesuccinocarboxamide synthase [marine benthic group bacterium]|jgi:phosphoribosylaminoimidazole-succinocarboxamide synthase|nr:phosphoribosylaminoimidazolesuccinocarboxamide synthase [Candidatus Benthicola marisminoris]
MSAVERSDLPFPLLRQGKVREMYDLGNHLLLVASDRISAFDVVIPQPIPDKGAVLTQMSSYWFDRTGHIVRNHCVSADPDRIVEIEPRLADTRDQWAGRGMLVLRADPFPVECVVRGFITGSAWKEYRSTGTLAGEPLPEGLVEAQQLDDPIFSPATKAEEGHDENITYSQVQSALGTKVAEFLREKSLELYGFARDHARRNGIIIADTKFEFGTSPTGELLLIDEALTPDSSRFWPEAGYEPGSTPPSLDKQPVRDYLEERVQAGEWDRQPPAPDLPESVVSSTTDRYREAFERITSHSLPEF